MKALFTISIIFNIQLIYRPILLILLYIYLNLIIIYIIDF